MDVPNGCNNCTSQNDKRLPGDNQRNRFFLRIAVTKEDEQTASQKESYNARFNLHTGMAHYVAEKLHLRPNEILDTWCVPELIVAYGHYMNEESQRSYQEWKQLDAKERAKTPKPQEYVVKFYGVQ